MAPFGYELFMCVFRAWLSYMREAPRCSFFSDGHMPEPQVVERVTDKDPRAFYLYPAGMEVRPATTSFLMTPKKSHYALWPGLLMLILLPGLAFAASKSETFTVNGLRYATEKYGQYVTLEGCEDTEIETLVVPDVVIRESDGQEYTVVRIGADYESLDEYIWSANRSMNHFCNMKNLRKVDLSKAVHLEKIGYFTTAKLSGKTYYRVSNVFCNNPNLTEIIFPQNGALTEIACSFNDLPISSIDLPEGLTTITANAFNDCRELKDVRLPSSITLVQSKVVGTSQYPFGNTDLDNLVILSEDFTFKTNISSKRTFMPYKEYNGATNTADHGEGSDRYFLLLDKNTALQPVLKLFRWDFQSYEVPFADHAPNSYTIDFSHSSDKDGKCSYEVSDYGDRFMSFSTPERTAPLSANIHALSLSYSPSDMYYGLDTYNTRRRSAPLAFSCKADDSFDKSTLTIMLRNTNQSISAPDQITNLSTRGKYTFTLEKLQPNTEYTVGLYFGNKHLADRSFKTKGLVPAFKQTVLDVTTFEGSGSYNLEGDEGDEIEEQYISFENKKYSGKEITLTGLAPETEYELSYCVKMTDTGMESKTFKFKTAGPLELKTVAPKVVSRSAAIVCAESNLREIETHAGLEWRKTDAPEEVPSKRVYITPIDGSMEGRIENLDASVYYKVRAFYEKYDGSKQWYGKWIGFDPSDFSYFVPTVRTFETVMAKTNSADVKGYVLAGTEDIISQGFEYWSLSSESANAPRMTAQANESYSTVLSNGPIMTATLPNLRPGTEYAFRSFAKTSGETTYGEERTFRTKEALSYIEEIESEQEAPTIEGYYDLRGVRHEEPVRGFNIIRYSDGTARKVIAK